MQLIYSNIQVNINDKSSCVDYLTTSYYFKYDDQWYIRKFTYSSMFNSSYVDWVERKTGFVKYTSSTSDGWFKKHKVSYFENMCGTPEIELEFLKQLPCD